MGIPLADSLKMVVPLPPIEYEIVNATDDVPLGIRYIGMRVRLQSDVDANVSTAWEWDGTNWFEVSFFENTAGITDIVQLTQTAYDALGTPDANTLYIIIG